MTETSDRPNRDVEASFVNPFLTALHDTLLNMAGVESQKCEPRLLKDSAIQDDILLFMGLEGSLTGMVIVRMNVITATHLVSAILFGVPIDEIDEMALNTLKEFALRVSVTAKKRLTGENINTSVHRGICIGKTLTFSENLTFICVPYHTDHGTITVMFNITKSERFETLL